MSTERLAAKVGQRIYLPGHFDVPVVLEEARPLGTGGAAGGVGGTGERRRRELEQQKSLTLQRVERLTSVLVLPHPEREAPDVQRLRANAETEAVAMEYERAQGRQVEDVHERNLGYDLTSMDPRRGELKPIEVKGIGGAEDAVIVTPNERRVAEDWRDCYWQYVVTDCDTDPRLQPPIKDPGRFGWNMVSKVAHYYLSVAALTAQAPPEANP
ncbi:MAG: hypothetical protein KatS3mg004_0014 [Bryobacteraceae bacterium]|nr:MAG: hypothetical protein KatS3mg004_0014 [Bryobacteraceae bacterium]